MIIGTSGCQLFNDIVYDEVENFKMILASIIQGSSLGPASYVMTTSDLHPVTRGHSILKFADDTYLIVSAANVQSLSSHMRQSS